MTVNNHEQLDVSRETLDDLKVYSGLLEEWTSKINLVSKSTLTNVWERHILDSAQLYQLTEARHKTWVDLGSGGGLPGLVIAILAKRSQKNSTIILIESDSRKAVFLKTVIRQLNLNVTVHTARIESLDPIRADVLTARALAPLNKLLDYANRHLHPNGRALFPKGSRWRQEILTAKDNWHFNYSEHPSKTDPNATILEIGDIHHV